LSEPFYGWGICNILNVIPVFHFSQNTCDDSSCTFWVLVDADEGVIFAVRHISFSRISIYEALQGVELKGATKDRKLKRRE
jgi:hypothetical protein